MNPKTGNASKAADFTVLLVTQRRTVNASSEAFFLFVVLQPHTPRHCEVIRMVLLNIFVELRSHLRGDITRIDITMMGQLIHTSFALLPMQRPCEQERHP